MTVYVTKNNKTKEEREFKTFEDLQYFYKHLTINESMNWSGWTTRERSDDYVYSNKTR